MSRRTVSAASAARAIRAALLATAIATLASVSAVWAYSREAVAAADRILQLTIQRQTTGVVQPWEVAVARYNLLDMTYKAKATREDAFCKSAKPQLEIVAAGLQVGDEHVGEKEEWAAAIAAMDTDRAKCRQASAGAETLLFDSQNYSGSTLSLEQAQVLLKLTEERREAGIASDVDLSQAQYRLMVAELRAGEIDHAAYCAKALPGLERLFGMLSQKLTMGVIHPTALFPAERQLAAAQAECNGRSRP
jgi:outer membrane protein TolC